MSFELKWKKSQCSPEIVFIGKRKKLANNKNRLAWKLKQIAKEKTDVFLKSKKRYSNAEVDA